MARRRKPTGSPGYIPGKIRKELVEKAADRQLSRFIDDKQDLKNQDAGVASIVQDMPEKFAKNFVNSKGEIGPEELGKKSRYYRADGSLNSAGLATLSQYTDERPEYSRQLNRLVNSSPQLKAAYARRFPISNFAMNVMPRFLPVVGPAFTADQAMKNKRLEQNYLNRPESDYNKFVEYFKPKMNNEQAATTEIIEGEQKPLISPADMNLQEAKSFVSPADMNLQEAKPFVSPQDMGFLDDENIFDTEKAAIDAALAPGTVYNPIEDDFRGKVDFINQALDGANYPYDEPNDPAYRPMIEKLFEKVKRNIGYKEIRPTANVDADNAQAGDEEDPIPGGQFDLTNPAFSDQTNLVLSGDPDYDFSNFNTNTELGSLSENPNLFPEGGVSGTPVTQAGQQLFFADGTPVTEPVDTGLTMVGDKAFPSSPGSQEALDILNSNATDGVDFSGYPTMGFNFADGGSTNKYENMSTHEKLMRMAAEMYG